MSIPQKQICSLSFSYTTYLDSQTSRPSKKNTTDLFELGECANITKGPGENIKLQCATLKTRKSRTWVFKKLFLQDQVLLKQLFVENLLINTIS